MSNYNSQLQSNNADLQTILNTINELPSAGGGSGGGGVETCTVTIRAGFGSADIGYHTTDGFVEDIGSYDSLEDVIIPNVLKNSLLCVMCYYNHDFSNYNIIISGENSYLYYLTEDTFIVVIGDDSVELSYRRTDDPV